MFVAYLFLNFILIPDMLFLEKYSELKIYKQKFRIFMMLKLVI